MSAAEEGAGHGRTEGALDARDAVEHPAEDRDDLLDDGLQCLLTPFSAYPPILLAGKRTLQNAAQILPPSNISLHADAMRGGRH
jgi:hypothetical protein